ASQAAQCVLIATLLITPLAAQDTPTPPSRTDIKQTFTKLCGGCHGDDARGTQQGPGLAGNPSIRRRSAQNIRRIIHNRIPSAGMPPFELPDPMIDALANLVVSLNASASENDVPGDRAAGQQFFFGKGQCASCHMVYGEGSAVGPDLSNLARERTVDEI